MNKEDLKSIVSELREDLEALEDKLSELVDKEEVTYEEIEDACADVDGMYDICPDFTARDKVRAHNDVCKKLGMKPDAFAL